MLSCWEPPKVMWYKQVIISFCFINGETKVWKYGEVYPRLVKQIQPMFCEYRRMLYLSQGAFKNGYFIVPANKLRATYLPNLTSSPVLFLWNYVVSCMACGLPWKIYFFTVFPSKYFLVWSCNIKIEYSTDNLGKGINQEKRLFGLAFFFKISFFLKEEWFGGLVFPCISL